jgi:hypothetical protein
MGVIGAAGATGTSTHAASVRKKFIPAAVKSMNFFIDNPPASNFTQPCKTLYWTLVLSLGCELSG